MLQTQRPDYVLDAIAAGVDEKMIERLVRAFYGDIRADEVLGPIFEARISDWEPHLQRMCAFWSSVMLRSGRYSGRPMPMHAPLPVGGAHFDRWLGLFEAAAQRECGAAADLFVARARMIAQSLELGIAGARGLILGLDERLPAP
ncbi:MAG TPA: group III truncated hemoglobin [Vitreimonas sp.]|uniref:group III truncated hemoglobin n=1 Tax=Vitreimonas sp. TaxID=3069702 RepID=UPI002D45CDA6|nr:group III truncated hemoglobin [Vitreimonas sp.]HYD89750.1 group III truncated hemoglobin [Vitreimonas sp.]